MEGDLQLDQDTFITKLALEILEGRSFDITGKKCSYERLFENVEMISSPGDDDDDEDEEADEAESDEPQTNPVPEEPVAGPSKAPARPQPNDIEKEVSPEDDPFVQDMVKQIDKEYGKILALEKSRVGQFRIKMTDKYYTQVEQMKMYAKHTHLDEGCKHILNNIQNLQNKYQNIERLKEVTDNLEKLSKVVNFD